MKHFAAGAMLALFALGLPAQGFAGDVDPASVPEIKRSKLQLYLTPQEAYDVLRKDAAHTLFLDVRTPWEYLDNCLAAVKPGARFAFFVPTVNQVSELLKAMEVRAFADTEVEEIFIRRWKALGDRLRPDDRMIAHTGFLIFARQQERSAEFEARMPKGTRERKQDAARRERLEAAGLVEDNDGDFTDDDL